MHCTTFFSSTLLLKYEAYLRFVYTSNKIPYTRVFQILTFDPDMAVPLATSAPIRVKTNGGRGGGLKIVGTQKNFQVFF